MNKCTLTNGELADALNKWADRLADTGGKAWSMRVPVDPNFDPDILMSEAARRLCSLPELPAPAEPETCEWELQSYGDYETTCGWTTGTPDRYKYCPYCGLPITIKPGRE